MSTSKAPPTSGPKAMVLASIQMTRPVKVRTSCADARETSPRNRRTPTADRTVFFIAPYCSVTTRPVKKLWQRGLLLAAQGRVEDVAEPVAGAADHDGGDHEHDAPGQSIMPATAFSWPSRHSARRSSAPWPSSARFSIFAGCTAYP